MSSFEQAETIAFVVTGAAIALVLAITGIFRIRRRLEEQRQDEMDAARVAGRIAEDDEL